MGEDAEAGGLLRRLILATFLIGLLLLSYRVLHLFLAPLAWAMILAYVTWPVYRRLRGWLPSPTGSALLMTVMLGAVIALPLVWLTALLRTEVPAVYRAAVEYIDQGPQALPEFIAGIPWLGAELQGLWVHLSGDVTALPRQLIRWSEPWVGEIIGVLGDVGRNAAKFGFALVIAFFMYRDGEEPLAQTRQLMLHHLGDRAEAYLLAIGGTIRAVMFGLILTALAQGVLAGLGYWAAGVKMYALLGAVTAMIALIPFGAPLVWGSVGVWLLLSQQVLAGVGVLLWGVLVISQIDNVIRPLVISSATRIPFLLVLFGVFGGISAFGLVGLFLGPVIVAVLLAVWREWLEEHRPVAPPVEGQAVALETEKPAASRQRRD
ncbi:MAG: AI-2E family transporter [Gammaproteobacteria bacterium]